MSTALPEELLSSRENHFALLIESMQELRVGVSIYGDDLRLVTSNPMFREIFDLPEAMVRPGSPLGPVIRLLAQRGAYGDVDVEAFVQASLIGLKATTQPFVFERKAADGHIFESHTSRLDSGGYLTIHTDITEHKRIQAELVAKSALLRAGTDNMPGAMAIWDADLRYLWWTPRIEEFFNLSPGTLKVGLPLSAVVRQFAERGDYGPGEIDALVEAQMRPFFERESLVAERRMPDGRVIESRRNPLPDGGYVSVFQDVTAQKRMQAELRLAKETAEHAVETLQRRQEQVKALLDSSGQGFLSFGQDLRIHEEYSRACLGIFGESPVGREIGALLLPGDMQAAAALRSQLHAIFAETEPFARDFRLTTLPREFQRGERVLLADFRGLENGDVMLVLTDVTAERNFMALSNTDRLTGLANRRRLDEFLEEESGRARRTQLPMAVIIADIDDFKGINDAHGHLKGDTVLVAIATIFRERARKIDRVGRWGGEEFMIVCPDTDAEGAYDLAEMLRQAVVGHVFEVPGAHTCSFGVAALRPGEGAEAVVQRADTALYRAKREGRNRVCVAALP